MIRIMGKWRYIDTEQLVAENPRRRCGFCGMDSTEEGHDGCLGTLAKVMNACCGHGVESDAYIQFWDGSRIGGKLGKAELDERVRR